MITKMIHNDLIPLIHKNKKILLSLIGSSSIIENRKVPTEYKVDWVFGISKTSTCKA